MINSLYGGELTANFKLLNQIIAEESAAEIDNSNKKSADDEERRLVTELSQEKCPSETLA